MGRHHATADADGPSEHGEAAAGRSVSATEPTNAEVDDSPQWRAHGPERRCTVSPTWLDGTIRMTHCASDRALKLAVDYDAIAKGVYSWEVSRMDEAIGWLRAA